MNFKNCLSFDVECLPNYFLLMFKKVTTGEVMFFEKFNDSELNRKNILYILNKYKLISFNGIKYDMLIIEAAIAGFSNAAIKKVSDMIINDNQQPWQVRKHFGFAALDVDHIDLIEVAPLKASLKLYSGRLHAKTMQDLPVDPSENITDRTRQKLIPYCENDNDDNILLAKRLEKEIDLRVIMGDEIAIDLRSKSDAQIAEAVIKYQCQTRYGFTPKKPKIDPDITYKYKTPKNIKFKTDQMKSVLKDIQRATFGIDKSGHVVLPESLQKYKFELAGSTFKIGLGGLHSCEKKTAHVAGKYLLKDFDVASYYPMIILLNGLFPEKIGRKFLEIFGAIVSRRLKAKAEGDKATAASLKITINGLFGKFGSKYSFVYAPNLMLQTTLTGQLSLLMLVESLALNGLEVVNGNTDGIVIKMLPEQQDLVDEIVFDWELATSYEMESTSYAGYYSRAVNDYIAIKTNGSVKGKGAYVDNRDHNGVFNLHNNPANEISSEAVKLFLRDKTPIEDTINACTDITKFVTVRTVNGGAGETCTIIPPPTHSTQLELLKMAKYRFDCGKWFAPGSKAKTGMTENGAYKRAMLQMQQKKITNYVGKAVRWYYSEFKTDPLYYVTSGNKVPRSEGAQALMTLPDTLPDDIDHEWYINEAKTILSDIGVV